MQNFARDLLWLLFPPSCPACNQILLRAEAGICTRCRQQLIKQTYQDDSVLNLKIRAELPVAGVYALFPFQRHGRIQQVLHNLKYQYRPEAGRLLGQWLGEQLLSLGWAAEADLIVPVPLHKKKLRQRGYNQAAVIGEGISRQIEKPLEENMLIRARITATQTRKSRLQRWLNVSEAFAIQEGREKTLNDKVVLLVDDVITTGATLEACAKILHPHCRRIYIVALASA